MKHGVNVKITMGVNLELSLLGQNKGGKVADNDNTQHYRPLPDNTQHYRPLPDNTQHYRPLPDNTQHYRPLPDNTQHYRPLPDNTQDYRPLPDNTQHYRPLPDSTQHSQQTDIHVHGEIRTFNPSQRAAAEPNRRQRDHRERCNGDRNIFISRLNVFYVMLNVNSTAVRLSSRGRNSTSSTCSFVKVKLTDCVSDRCLRTEDKVTIQTEMTVYWICAEVK